MEKGNPKLAIRYAKRIMKDGEGIVPADIAPGTKVYELVKELVKYLLENKKDKFIDKPPSWLNNIPNTYFSPK